MFRRLNPSTITCAFNWKMALLALFIKPPSSAALIPLPQRSHRFQRTLQSRSLMMHMQNNKNSQTFEENEIFPSRRNIFSQAAVSLVGLSFPFQMDARAIELEVCSNGSIAAENAVPGAYSSECMSLTTRNVKLKSTNEDVIIVQGSADGQGVTGRTGVALWNSGLLLTRTLDFMAQEERDFFQGKTVLELGCGTGLASIAASKFGAANVIATDGNEEVVKLAKQNLENNNIYASTNSQSSSERTGEAQYLKWGSLDVADFYDTADIVIGSDLTYNSGSWGLLSETVNDILKPSGLFCYVTLGHAGFNVASELGGFLTLVDSQGSLEVVKEGSSAWPFQNVPSLEKLVFSSLTFKEREVIAGTGGFKVILFRKRKKRR